MAEETEDTGPLPTVKIQTANSSPDYATILGLFFAIGFIVAAIAIGQSNANFFNVPSLMIVLFGSMAATSISYTGEELKKAGKENKDKVPAQLSHAEV